MAVAVAVAEDALDHRVAQPGVPYFVKPVQEEQNAALPEALLQHFSQREVHAPLGVVAGDEVVEAHVFLRQDIGVGRERHQDGQACLESQRFSLTGGEAERQELEERGLARSRVAEDDQAEAFGQEVEDGLRRTDTVADRLAFGLGRCTPGEAQALGHVFAPSRV